MPDPASLSALVALGIPRQKALFALREHADEVEAAADWCLGEGASWTPASLLQTTFAAPPTAHETADPHRREPQQPTPHRLVPPGTRVSITLKADQGTGRTVQGVVAERLTRGDHPRGVKVRLEDGRVGRVVSVLK
ncbi:hypothetical protein JCM3770_004460 [Rhodotorula araucariae]